MNMALTTSPSRPDGDGRAPNGRFATGNRFSRGNPLARRAGRLRAELFRTVTADRLKAVILALLERAEAGDVSAAREILERCLGRAVEIDVLQRIEDLETRLADRGGR